MSDLAGLAIREAQDRGRDHDESEQRCHDIRQRLVPLFKDYRNLTHETSHRAHSSERDPIQCSDVDTGQTKLFDGSQDCNPVTRLQRVVAAWTLDHISPIDGHDGHRCQISEVAAKRGM